MLTLPIQKDLAEYEPKIIGKFTKRTLICTACALAASLLMAFYLNSVICVGIDDWGWLGGRLLETRRDEGRGMASAVCEASRP